MAKRAKKRKGEQEFCTKLQKWMRYNIPVGIFWEAKYVYKEQKKYYFSDKSLAKEIINLKIGQKHGIIHKFTDATMTGTMFDGFWFKGKGYFFIQFEIEKPKLYRFSVKTIEKLIKDGYNGIDIPLATVFGDEFWL